MTERMKKLEALLADDGESPFLLFAIAKEYEGIPDLKAALAQYQSLEAKSPDYVGLYYHLGKLQEKMEDLASAQATYERGMAVAKSQGDKHAHGELSTAHWEITDD